MANPVVPRLREILVARCPEFLVYRISGKVNGFTMLFGQTGNNWGNGKGRFPDTTKKGPNPAFLPREEIMAKGNTKAKFPGKMEFLLYAGHPGRERHEK
jgi:hypothetical protein